MPCKGAMQVCKAEFQFSRGFEWVPCYLFTDFHKLLKLHEVTIHLGGVISITPYLILNKVTFLCY